MDCWIKGGKDHEMDRWMEEWKKRKGREEEKEVMSGTPPSPISFLNITPLFRNIIFHSRAIYLLSASTRQA